MKKTNQSGFIGGVLITCIIIIMILGILYFVKLAITSKPSPVATSTTSTASSSVPVVVRQDVTIKDIDNSMYLVWGQKVTMVNGRYRNGKNPATDKNYIDSSISLYTIGDINGDKREDAIVQTATSLGNAYVYELHALVKQDGVASSTLLTIPVQAGSVRTVDDIFISTKGIISLTLSIIPPGGAMCCPTIHTTNQYRFDGTKLVLTATSTKQ